MRDPRDWECGMGNGREVVIYAKGAIFIGEIKSTIAYDLPELKR
jgi:hypothetical protein